MGNLERPIDTDVSKTDRGTVRIKRPRSNGNHDQAPNISGETITIIGGPHLQHERLGRLFDRIELNKSSQ